MRSIRVAVAALALTTGAVLPAVTVVAQAPASAAACGGLLQPACPTPTPTPTPIPTPPPTSNHTVGSCHALTWTEFMARSDADRSVSCARRHTSLTVRVSRVKDGTRRSDATSIARQVDRGCYNAMADRVGGWSTYLRSFYWLTVYVPTKRQWSHGARWVRCDMVLGDSRKQLQQLPTNSELADSALGFREEWCRMGRSADYRSTPCSRPHQFMAEYTIRMGRWRGTKAAKNFAIHACLKRVGTLTPFFYDYPHTKRWFSFGARYVICLPKVN